MNLKLRKAEPGDLAACLPVFEDSAIYERYFKGDGRLERSLATAVERGELHLAVTDSGEIAGAMRVMPRGFCGLYPYLSLIGVKACYRGQKVGAWLMARLEDLARESGAARVTLMVSDFNLGAQRFYQQLGYWQLGTIPDAAKPGIAELVLIKDLGEAPRTEG